MKRNFMVLILTLLVALTTVGMAPGIAIADLLMLVVCGVPLTLVARLPEAGKPSGA
jgi:hypothetical protein